MEGGVFLFGYIKPSTPELRVRDNELYKAFYCGSWLLDHSLIDLLGRDANISKFSARFTTFGVKSAGLSPLNFVFHLPKDTKIEELPENSRLQRILKKHYLDGKAIYDMHGIFF